MTEPEFKLRPDRQGGRRQPIDLPTSSPLDSSLTIVSRQEWGAEPSVYQRRLEWLPSYVRFVHTESVNPCETREGCIRDVRELQKRDRGMGHSDINFSFLVGEGGTVYEGRGWKVDHDLPEPFKEVQGKCISIAYMGHYKFHPPPYEKLVGAFNLLIHGINHKLISPFMDFQHLVFEKVHT